LGLLRLGALDAHPGAGTDAKASTATTGYGGYAFTCGRITYGNLGIASRGASSLLGLGLKLFALGQQLLLISRSLGLTNQGALLIGCCLLDCDLLAGRVSVLSVNLFVNA
jgi:hypothetical protein